MNVAESSPASLPSVASSISTPNPRRSAQREYIRNNISVQSWASVPPAPACSSTIASFASYCPLKRLWVSSAAILVSSDVTVEESSFSDDQSASPAASDSRENSANTNESSSEARSSSNCSRSFVRRPSSVVTSRARSWSSQRFGSATSSPSTAWRSRLASIFKYSRAALHLASRSSKVPRASRRAFSALGSAMALLELPARGTPARLVSTDLVALFGQCLLGGSVGRKFGGAGRHDVGVRDGALESFVGLGHFLDGLNGGGLDVRDVAHEVRVHVAQEDFEHQVTLFLPRRQRVLLGDLTQVDTVAQVVHVREVITPTLVEDLEHDVALDLLGGVHATRVLFALLLVLSHGLIDHECQDVVADLILRERVGAQRCRVVVHEFDDELVKIPTLGEFALEAFVHDVGENLFD